MKSFSIYAVTALAEIAGCFAFWAWLRLDKSVWWLVPGMAALALFAWLLTQVDSDAAGRAYAAYGGVYIVASLLWMWAVEGVDWHQFHEVDPELHQVVESVDCCDQRAFGSEGADMQLVDYAAGKLLAGPLLI